MVFPVSKHRPTETDTCSRRMSARLVWPSVAATCLALSILLLTNIAAPLERVTPGGSRQSASPPLASPPIPPLLPPIPPSRITLRPSPRYAEAFDAAIDGVVWLVAAGPVELRHQGVMHSSDPSTPRARRLRLLNRSTSTGSDALGPFTRTAWAWRAGNLAFHTGVRLYHATLVFEQRYGSEAAGTAGHGLSSSFPCFGLPGRTAARVEAAAAAARRYWLQWDGDMAGQLYRTGPWQVVLVLVVVAVVVAAVLAAAVALYRGRRARASAVDWWARRPSCSSQRTSRPRS